MIRCKIFCADKSFLINKLNFFRESFEMFEFNCRHILLKKKKSTALY